MKANMKVALLALSLVAFAVPASAQRFGFRGPIFSRPAPAPIFIPIRIPIFFAPIRFQGFSAVFFFIGFGGFAGAPASPFR